MATTVKTPKKKALKVSLQSKRQLSPTEKNKLIKELSDNANRNMSFKLMVRLMANRNK